MLWIGSIITAATCSLIVEDRASRSPNGANCTPGSKGSKPALYFGLAVIASAPIVRPWNAPSIAIMVGRPVNLRDSLRAVSFASAPELQKKTCPYPSGATPISFAA